MNRGLDEASTLLETAGCVAAEQPELEEFDGRDNGISRLKYTF